MSSSNYSHQLKMHQVRDLEEMVRELDTLSDVAYTVWHAMKAEGGDSSIAGCSFDMANRLFDLKDKLKTFTEERAAEAEVLGEESEIRSIGGSEHD